MSLDAPDIASLEIAEERERSAHHHPEGVYVFPVPYLYLRAIVLMEYSPHFYTDIPLAAEVQRI